MGKQTPQITHMIGAQVWVFVKAASQLAHNSGPPTSRQLCAMGMAHCWPTVGGSTSYMCMLSGPGITMPL